MSPATTHIERLESRTLLSAPMVITRGGTYRGTWESTDWRVPAVTIETTQPVVIENSVLRGPGHLIATSLSHAKLTVRNCWAYGKPANVAGLSQGRFINAERFDSLTVQYNHVENTRGIHLLDYAGNHTLQQSIRIDHNAAHNIDGRKSDGRGGYLYFNQRVSRTDGHVESGWDDAQFVQLDKVVRVPGIDIGYNRVINDPGHSRVEDNINLYLSSGTPASPIRIHDNYIRGAYTLKPWQASHTDSNWVWDWSYSGGGIMLGDGKNASSADDSAYAVAYGNTVVGTTNYGIAVSAGHDLQAYGNRIVSCGRLADGRPIAQQNVGLYIWDSYHAGRSRFYNNIAHDNLVGWMRGSARNDWWVPNASKFTNNTRWPGSLTLATENAQLALWQRKAASA